MSTHFNPANPPRPKRIDDKWWKHLWVHFAAVGFVMLFMGMAIGASGKDKPADAAPTPAVTVTATPAPAPTVTKTVEKTPPSCIRYIDLSETVFTYSAEAMGYMSEAMQAAGRFDVAGVEAASAKLDILNPKLSALAPSVNAAKAECRTAAK